MKKILVLTLVIVLMLAVAPSTFAAKQISVNVLLNTEITDDILAELGQFGKVGNKLIAIDALTMKTTYDGLAEIQALPFVAAANPDAERHGAPIDTVFVDDFSDGFNTWNLDVVNVTGGPFDTTRDVPFDGTGVYVAVLDTGLVDTWRMFFPEERIAEEFAKSFGGGGGENGNVSEQPNKWEHDQNSHGTHVTSTILGYQFGVNMMNGVAPMVTIIPVKVLNQNGSGWSSVIAEGIMYIADLKLSGDLGDAPVVINMSLGGPVLDAVEQAAIDYAINAGVIIVASAGNSGEAGMGYPGAYAPVISVAASGWVGEWYPPGNRAWWYNLDDPELGTTDRYYITDFSSRELPGQDLDVAAPGSWVVGPYKVNSGNTPSYYFLGGTSMASPHVAGIAALMMQKNDTLVQADVESILEGAALPMGGGCQDVYQPSGAIETICWGTDATGNGLITADGALAGTP